MQKRIVSILSTALVAWTATKLAGMFLDEPEERGSEDDVKRARRTTSIASKKKGVTHNLLRLARTYAVRRFRRRSRPLAR